MSRFDELIGRATRRLSPDPELQLEVAHELRTHLEDSTAEYRAAGLNEDEAATKATESFGNPDQVAEKLLAANRSRMRIRRITRVAAGATFGSAAAIATIIVGWSAIVSLLTAGWSAPVLRASRPPLVTYNRVIDELPGEQQFLFRGGQAPGPTGYDEAAVAKALAERWPADAVYAAIYAARSAQPYGIRYGVENWPTWDPREVSEALAVIDRGARVEPDNGFYPLLRAALLLKAGCEVLDLLPDNSRSLTVNGPNGPEVVECVYRLKLSNQSMIEQGLAALHEAAARPYIDNHADELLRRRLAALPQSTRLQDQIARLVLLQNGTGLSGSECYDTAILAGSFAVDRAAAGERKRAEEILNDEMALSRMVAARARTPSDLFVASGVREAALAQIVVVDQVSGLGEHALAAKAAYESEVGRTIRLSTGAWKGWDERRARAGLLESYVLFSPAAPPDPKLSAASWAFDRSLADQIALAALASLLLIGSFPVVPQVARRLRRRPRPPSLFIGWLRLAGVVLIGAVLPLATYAVVTYSVARSYGIAHAGWRLPLRYAALAAIVAVLLRLTTNWAMRRRARELRIAIPAPDRMWRAVQIAVSGALALATAVYLAVWRGPGPSANLCAAVLVAALGMYTLASLLSAGSRPLFVGREERVAFLHKLSSRFPGWRLCGGFAALLALSLWLMWAVPPGGNRLGALPVIQSVVWSLTATAGLAVLVLLADRSPLPAEAIPMDQLGAATGWRAAPLSLAAAALAVLLIGFPFLRHIQRASIIRFDQSLRLWDLRHGPYAKLQDQIETGQR